MHHHNDNAPRRATDFPDTPEGLAARRAFLETAPATHAPHRAQSPVVTWAKREKDSATFFGLRRWSSLNEPPSMAANDNSLEDQSIEAGEQPALPNVDCELVDVSAKQLKYAAEHGMVRWQGNRLAKVWSGHKWVSPDVEFGDVRRRVSDKADTECFDAEIPDVEVELARSVDAERLRARLGSKMSTILDMAIGASTLLEVGEYLGFSGQYATRIARNEIRAAVAALNAAMAVEDREAA